MRICPKCQAFHERNHAYCLDCHNANMRSTRKRHRELSHEQRKRANARAYANVYKRRGKLMQLPCETCGDSNSQMHHHDYDKPLEVEWLCRECHLREHTTT